MKILLAVDGSEHTRRALAYLAAHDEWLGARHTYTVVHAATALPHRAAAFQGLDVARSFYEDDAELIFKPVRQFLAMHGIQATFVLRIGHPAKHIAALARSGRFDLLIMGSHGHGAAAGLLMGSVATRVLALCATPVLLIR